LISLKSSIVPSIAVINDLQAAAPRLAQKDPTLWGNEFSSESATRLGWVSSPSDALLLLPRIAELVSWAAGRQLNRVILCGMGGSSLAPEVICNSYDKEIIIVDTTDPGQIHSAIAGDLAHSVVVISSKSGSTIETDSAKRAFEAAFKSIDLRPSEHLIIVTDPQSTLHNSAVVDGYQVLLADPNVGGRYSALTAFGLLPSALAGVDIAGLIHEAISASSSMANLDSPAIALAAILGEHEKSSPYVALLTKHGIGDWIEQLVAESTGKSDHGLLPIVVENSSSPGFKAQSVLSVSINREESADLNIDAPLGAQFVLWEWATALASRIIEINPFDQPNVAESKAKTALMLEDTHQLEIKPNLSFEYLEVFGNYQGQSLADALAQFMNQIPSNGYLAIMAFLDRFTDSKAIELRSSIALLIEKPVTFGWGPRFLHSTGQFHKGNPSIGSFLQITGDTSADYPISERPYSFHTLQMAQAIGDGQALKERQVPIIRLHLKERDLGLAAIGEAVAELILRREVS